jgi:hypothetical protein
MATRADTIFNRYARAVIAQEMIADSLQQFAGDEQRAQALEALAAQERANLTALEESFEVAAIDFGAAGQALQDQYSVQRAAMAAQAAALASRRLSASQRNLLTDPSRDSALNALLGLAADESVTAEQLAEAEQVFNRTHSPLLVDERNAFVSAQPATRARALPARTEELTQAERGTEQALRALYFQGRQGIFGGFEGEAEINARQQRQAPSGSKFASGEDAFNVYLRLLEDGQATAEELATEMGYESAQAAAADFAFAKAQYDNARATGGFTNAQRKYFENRWLEAARQARSLQERAEAARERVPEDPRQAAIQQELLRRGIDIADPFLRYRGTPLHGILTDAERLYQAGDVSAGENKQLQGVVSLLRQYRADGKRWTVDELEQQLKGTLKGDELTGALSFALAFQRQMDEGGAGSDSDKPLMERRAPEPEPEPEQTADQMLMERTQLRQELQLQRQIQREIEAQTAREAQQQAPPAPAPEPEPAPEPAPAPAAAPAQTDIYQQRLQELQADTSMPARERQQRISAIRAELTRRGAPLEAPAAPAAPAPVAAPAAPAQPAQMSTADIAAAMAAAAAQGDMAEHERLKQQLQAMRAQ